MAYRKTEAILNEQAERREAILDAAIELVKQHGREHVTMTDIAEHAEMSIGVMYKYFADLAELWKQAAILARDRHIEKMRAAAAKASDGPHAIGAAMLALYGALGNVRLARALFTTPNYRTGMHDAVAALMSEHIGLKQPGRAAEAALGTLYGMYEMTGGRRASGADAAKFALQCAGLPEQRAAKIIAEAS